MSPGELINKTLSEYLANIVRVLRSPRVWIMFIIYNIFHGKDD